jgi:hypothetical protein
MHLFECGNPDDVPAEKFAGPEATADFANPRIVKVYPSRSILDFAVIDACPYIRVVDSTTTVSRVSLISTIIDEVRNSQFDQIPRLSSFQRKCAEPNCIPNTERDGACSCIYSDIETQRGDKSHRQWLVQRRKARIQRIFQHTPSVAYGLSPRGSAKY